MTCVSASISSSWMWKFTCLLGAFVVAAKPFSSRIRSSGSRSCTGGRRGRGATGLAAADGLRLVDLLLHRLALCLGREGNRPLPCKVGLAGLARERRVLDQRDVVRRRL